MCGGAGSRRGERRRRADMLLLQRRGRGPRGGGRLSWWIFAVVEGQARWMRWVQSWSLKSGIEAVRAAAH
jgi:hypothetical protein